MTADTNTADAFAAATVAAGDAMGAPTSLAASLVR